jgi:hypothetical protein
VIIGNAGAKAPGAAGEPAVVLLGADDEGEAAAAQSVGEAAAAAIGAQDR